MINISATLSTHGLLKISGMDTRKFLQGQLTCDVEKITASASLGAYCNPQGRVISLFDIFLWQDAYFLFMPRSMIPITTTALKKYAVFFQVNLTDVSESLEELTAAIDGVPITKADKISKGVPSIYPETSEKFLPHELNLHLLNALSFEKGCYTGQEIIARMQYRAKLKNHLYAASLNCPTPPAPGANVYFQEEQKQQPCGTIVDSCNVGYNEYLVLLVTDETSANAQTLYYQNQILTIKRKEND